MGLDMYLNKKTYIGNKYRKPENMVTVTMPTETQDTATFPIREAIKNERIQYIEEGVGYWRKANHIHKWFVDNVQDGNDDCGEYEVSEDKLSELSGICKAVLNDQSLAEALLPCQSGFFFGGTAYDEYYFKSLHDTIEIIDSVIAEKGDNEYLSGELYYTSSW